MRRKKGKILVKIGTPKQMDDEIYEIIDNPEKAEEKPQHTIYLTPKQFQQYLSKEKIRLLTTIREENRTITQLSTKLGRKVENVSRDLKELENIGFIEVKNQGRQKHPKAHKQITITI